MESTRLSNCRNADGAQGGIRTHTPVKAADFESAASTVPPLGPDAVISEARRPRPVAKQHFRRNLWLNPLGP